MKNLHPEAARQVAQIEALQCEVRINKPRIRPIGMRCWYCTGRGVEGRPSANPEVAYWDWFWSCLRRVA
jgi:hypothetical protein